MTKFDIFLAHVIEHVLIIGMIYQIGNERPDWVAAFAVCAIYNRIAWRKVFERKQESKSSTATRT